MQIHLLKIFPQLGLKPVAYTFPAFSRAGRLQRQQYFAGTTRKWPEKPGIYGVPVFSACSGFHDRAKARKFYAEQGGFHRHSRQLRRKNPTQCSIKFAACSRLMNSRTSAYVKFIFSVIITASANQ